MTHVLRLLGGVAAYVVGLYATVGIFILTNGSGLDGNPRDLNPYYAVFGVLLGGLFGRWWLVTLPALHLYVVEPLWRSLDARDLPYSDPYRRDAVLVGTFGIAIGVIAKLVVSRRATRSAAASKR